MIYQSIYKKLDNFSQVHKKTGNFSNLHFDSTAIIGIQTSHYQSIMSFISFFIMPRQLHKHTILSPFSLPDDKLILKADKIETLWAGIG